VKSKPGSVPGGNENHDGFAGSTGEITKFARANRPETLETLKLTSVLPSPSRETVVFGVETSKSRMIPQR
jgi:hypothetical protein